MPRDFFDEEIAAGYDLDPQISAPAAVDPVVDFLTQLAGDASALELEIGTGRIALPLSRRGVRVRGIDLSEAMVRRLRDKPGAEAIDVTIGDFATTKLGERFRLVYLVYNGIVNLTTQEAQVECFQNASQHLEPGGCLVIEVLVPALRRLPPGDTVRAVEVTQTHLSIDEYDTATQAAVSHHYWAADGGMKVWSMPWRYVWPSELDLMACLAGMTLRERWGSWDREAFTSDSVAHISVWELPEQTKAR